MRGSHRRVFYFGHLSTKVVIFNELTTDLALVTTAGCFQHLPVMFSRPSLFASY